MDERLVIITYIAGEAQGSELTLAIEGWRRHFKSPHRIVVVGDQPPTKDVEFLPIERLPEKENEYRPHLDICNKLLAVCEHFGDDYNGFIWASDDCFPVNDFTFADIACPKYQDAEMPAKGEKHFNPWWRNLVKTRKFCETKGFGVVNWVTHLPLWFLIPNLTAIIRAYDLTERSYVVENIYYNAFTPQGEPERADKWKLSSHYTPLDRTGFADALANKIWVCASVNGWGEALEQELRKHYQLND